MLRRLAPLAALSLAVASCVAGDPVLGEGVAIGATTTTSTTTPQAAAATTTTASPGAATAGVVVIPAGGAPLYETPDGTQMMVVHQGITMGFTTRQGEYLEVVTTCNDPAWVREGEVEVTGQATRAEPGPGFDLSGAVIVLDPGHGDRDWGGVGPSGLAEKTVNLDIAERVRSLMLRSNDVDWITGAVTDGAAVEAFGTVWLTRDRNGPNDGDFELGLGFRAELANAAGADAFVSIHNNTVPRISTEIPGTEVFYSIATDQSDRLASLIYQELLLGFAAFEADWTGGDLLGARARIDPETGEDYYGVLRRSEMPAVIVEGIYISEPDQEALLESDEFRQAYAESVYRGVVRFLTTDETGEGIREPELFPDDAGTVDSSACQIPSQP
jgi:N-acetylmuramoyl-L-alanine amidase